MSTLMERGMSLIGRALPKAAGGEIQYSRGDDRITIAAAFGRTEFQVEDSNGVRLVHSDRDFIVQRDLLTLGGAIANPQRGDRITMIDPLGRFGDVFEVLAPGGSDVYSEEPTGTLYRIHGKKIA